MTDRIEEALEGIREKVEGHLVASSDVMVAYIYGFLTGTWVKSTGVEREETNRLLERVRAEMKQRELDLDLDERLLADQ